VSGEYEPVFTLSQQLPGEKGKPRLRRLEIATLDDFIVIEQPSTSITGQYARVISTLRNEPYTSEMLDLALRIANEGAQHERSFRDLKRVFSDYDENDYLRPLNDAAPTASEMQPVVAALKRIVTPLTTAYRDRDDFARVGRDIVSARAAMNDLLDIGEALAARGIGIPFFDLWPKVLAK
jgi:hypothetical protein